MKKVAFTVGLAFFAIGLFAQNASSTSNIHATPVNAAKVAPAKTAAAQPTMQAHSGNSVAATPAQKSKPKPATASLKAKPGTGEKAVTPVVKKHRKHKAKNTTTATSSTPKATKQ